jgi:hypothetical protein
MKTLISLAIALSAFATISLAQPGDPNCGQDPDQNASVGAWNLSVAPTTINNGLTYDLILTYTGPTTNGVASSNVTVGMGTTQPGLTLSPYGTDYWVPVPCSPPNSAPSPIVVATITVTNTSGVVKLGKHKIINVSNGHSIGVQFANFSVNP